MSLPGALEYRCAAELCHKRDKVWPRADNFRQHCQRLHPEIDTLELMKKSLLSDGGPRPGVFPTQQDTVEAAEPRTDLRSELTYPDVTADRVTVNSSPLNESVDNNDTNSLNNFRERALDNRRDADLGIRTPSTASLSKQNTAREGKAGGTSGTSVAQNTNNTAPASSFKFPRTSTGWEPASMTYYVYSDCTDPGSHFAGKRLEGISRPNALKAPPERFIITAGKCPTCPP